MNEGVLRVRKKNLQDQGMTDAAFLDEATGWARRLTQVEARGPGDLENAWRRLEHKHGIPWRTFWSLRYRPPRDLAVSIYHRLRSAYEAECERQIRRLEHDLLITRQIAGPAHPVVAAAQAVVDSSNEGEG